MSSNAGACDWLRKQCITLMNFRVAPQAESDLDDIRYFLATQSIVIDVADRMLDSITARFPPLEPGAHRLSVAMKTCDQVCAVSCSETT
jgi:hypothetical protein